jgi:MraZ protein
MGNMFIGEYSHTIDDKGRLAIPAKFRALLKNGGVVTKGLDNCLFLYTKKEWQQIAERLANLPFNKANDRALARHFLAGAMDLDFDTQGRLNLPEYLREFASLKKKVIVAGLYNRLEIWNDGAWKTYRAKMDKESNTIAEALEGVTIDK